MKIVGIEGLSAAQLRDEVDRGGRFVVYGWCVSFLILTLKRSSDVTFVRAGHSRVGAGLGWTVLSFFLGWWGFPWGFIYTPMVLIQNLGGGTDVTARVMAELETDLSPSQLTPHVSMSPASRRACSRRSRPSWGRARVLARCRTGTSRLHNAQRRFPSFSLPLRR